MTKRQQIKFYEALHSQHAKEIDTLMTRIKRKKRNHQTVTDDEAKLRRAKLAMIVLEIHIENRRAA